MMIKPVNHHACSKATAEKRSAETEAPVVHGLDTWGGHTKTGVPWEVRWGNARTVLASMKADRFSCVVTSPPYYSQRDYGVQGRDRAGKDHRRVRRTNRRCL